MPPVHLIGLGMSPADLPAVALEIIAQAQVLAGGRRHLDYFPDFDGRRIILGKNLTAALEEIAAAAVSQRVVVLASGDPNFHGIGPRLVRRLGPDQVVIHPNITAVQAASAILGLSWDDAAIVSLHGRDFTPLLQVLGQRDKIFVYTSGAADPATIAAWLARPEAPPYRLCILEDLGQENQRLTWLKPEEVGNRRFSTLNLVLLLAEPTAANPLFLGVPDEFFEHEAGLITKSEIRAVVMAKLQLQPGQVLWDIGAGSGSVGLEASLLLPGGRIFAVEQHPDRVEQIRANQKKFRVAKLEVVSGHAPECLAPLPPPQRVFIGGGGRDLPEILEVVRQRLTPGGRVVLTATLLETLATAIDLLTAWGWTAEVCQVQLSRSRPLSGSLYLQALNPVWIISATAREESS